MFQLYTRRGCRFANLRLNRKNIEKARLWVEWEYFRACSSTEKLLVNFIYFFYLFPNTLKKPYR